MYKLSVFSVFILLSTTLSGQEQKDFAYYNNETYQLYLDEDWKALIQLGKESIDNNFDYYYLRMRIGIAYYAQQRYTQAIKQFEKALDFTPGSVDAKSYLYYCYVYLGRSKEATKFFGEEGEKSKFLSALTFEPGIKISDNRANTRDTKYAFVGITHDLGRTISLFHGYQLLNADFALPAGNGFGQNETIYSVVQNEYYAALTLLAGKGFYIVPAIHLQQVKSDTYQGVNKVFALQIIKWLSLIKLYAGLTYSDINEVIQNQYEGGMVIYPLGNLNFYLQTQLTSHSQGTVQNFITFNKLGFRLFPKTWIDISYTNGAMYNYSDLNAYVIYNQLDKLSSKTGFTITQSLGKHFLYLNYTQENKEEYITESPFTHHNIVLGFNLTL